MQNIRPLGGHGLLLLLVQFGLLLLVARALGEGARRLRLPSVVGELVAGLAVGPSLLGVLAPGVERALFPAKAQQVHLIEVLSWIGVIMLLILTGLETDVGLIMRKGKGALAISAGGITVPFAAGFALASVLPGDFVARADQRLVFMLFVGTAMSISAIPVIAKVLMDMDIMRRDIGQITLAAGMLDDTVGWILLSVVSGLAAEGVVNPGTVGRSIVAALAVFGISLTLARPVVAAIMRHVDNRVGGEMAKITTLMVVALTFASITQLLGLEAALGAFIGGILVGQVRRFDHQAQQTFRTVALGVFAPVFFAVSGLRVDLASLAHVRVLAVGSAVLAVAILGKFIGAYVGSRVSRLGHWEALSLGAGMNARGAMEIIVATIGLSLGVLTPQMYSIILLTAIATSLMAPPLLRWTLKRVEMGEEELARLEAESRRRESFVANLKRVLIAVTADAGFHMASEIVRLMLRGEDDVEVTTLYLRPPDDEASVPGDGEPAAGPEEQQANGNGETRDTRILVRPSDGQPGQAVLAEAERGYDLLVIGTPAPALRAGTNGEQRTGGDQRWLHSLRLWRRPGPRAGAGEATGKALRETEPAVPEARGDATSSGAPGDTSEPGPREPEDSKGSPSPTSSSEAADAGTGGSLTGEELVAPVPKSPDGRSHQDSGEGDEGALFSPFVDELVQRSPCPVLIVTAGSPDGDGSAPVAPQRVVLPVWGHHGVSRGAEIAFSIARDRDAIVDVVHPVEGSRRRLGPGSRKDNSIGKEMVDQMAELGRSMGATVASDVMVTTKPEQAVIDHAKRHGALIVLETTRAPVSQRAFFGYDVDVLLGKSPCPVAIITVPQTSRAAPPTGGSGAT